MSLNCNEINLVLSELDLEGAFLQDVVQPNFDSLAMYTFKPGAPKTVFVCLASGACRICETRRKITKNEKPLRFNELLKSKLKGARICKIEQIGLERIIKIEFLRAGTIFVMPKAQEKFAKKSKNREEEQADEKFSLYIRLWSNAANVFLCDENDVIIDSFFRRPAKNEMPGEKFVLPEIKNQTKEFPIRDFAETKEKIRAENEKRGFFGDISFNEIVDLFYFEGASSASIGTLLEQAQKWHESHKNRLLNALEKLKEKRTQFLNADSLKHSGDLILANAHLFRSDSNFIECEDWETNQKTRIKIDAKKSPQENAQEYYTKYKKSVSGLESLENDIARTQKEIEKIDLQYAQMTAEKNPIKLEQILRKTQTPKQLEKKSHPGLSYEIDGWTIFVGRDADENDELLRHFVRGQDWWLHARDYHGGYVFIKNRVGKSVPLEILLCAGNLAVHFSKARKNGSADLYYTQVKHLRRAKNGPKGLVLPTNEKNLFVKIDESILRKLEENAR